MIKAKEALHKEREQLNADERERRREFAAIENKLSKREDILEDKIQEVTDKEVELDKLKDQLIEKEDFLAEIVQKQTVELERIAGMSTEDAKRMLLEQLKSDLGDNSSVKKQMVSLNQNPNIQNNNSNNITDTKNGPILNNKENIGNEKIDDSSSESDSSSLSSL